MRSSFQVQKAVLFALFLREAVNRLSAGRAAWLWILFEPLVHIVFLMLMFTFVRQRTVGGIQTSIWVMVGLLAFFMFRRTGTRAMNAINSNKALFAYRQIKPVDTILVRAALEGFLMILVSIVLLTGASLFGLPVIPADPLAVLEALGGLWLVGLGFGLITSVATELVQEMGRIIGLIMTPLYFISGVIYPIAKIPPPYREWLLLNPLVHGLEAVRLGFAPYYHAIPELSVTYLYLFALVSIFLGLALQVRFANELVAR